jgi:hypothetical protein
VECEADSDCGTCQTCSYGQCINVAAGGTAPSGQCDTGCFDGKCDGSGACSYYTSGQNSCADCYQCLESGTGECSVVDNNTDPNNSCDGVCLACQSGVCDDATNGSDPKDNCSPYTCTDYIYGIGSDEKTCKSYKEASPNNGNCFDGFCASIQQSCQNEYEGDCFLAAAGCNIYNQIEVFAVDYKKIMNSIIASKSWNNNIFNIK